MMTAKIPIKPIRKTKEIDYGDEDVKYFWKSTESPVKVTENQGKSPQEIIIGMLSKAIKLSDNTQIYIQTGKIDDLKIIATLSENVRNTNRIYILLGSEPKEDIQKSLAYKVLIRYGISFSGTYILVINDNYDNLQGIFFPHSLEEGFLLDKNNVLIFLNYDQIRTLHKFFIYNFWKRAKWECTFDKANPRRVEVDNLPINAINAINAIEEIKRELANSFCNKEYVKEKITTSEKIKVVSSVLLSEEHNEHLNWINEENVTNTTYLFARVENKQGRVQVEGYSRKLIKRLADLNINIYGSQQVYNEFILTNSGGWIFPIRHSSEHLFWCVELTIKQAQQLRKTLPNPDFHFIKRAKRKELKNKVIFLIDKNKEITISDHSVIDLGNVIPENGMPDKSEFEKLEPKEFPDDGKNIKITYEWTILPFYTPENAKISHIYDRWKKLQEKFQNSLNSSLKKIESLLNTLEELNKELENDKLKGLSANLELLRNKHNMLINYTDKLPTLSEDRRKQVENEVNAYLGRLSDLEKRIRKVKSLYSEIKELKQASKEQNNKEKIKKKLFEIDKILADPRKTNLELYEEFSVLDNVIQRKKSNNNEFIIDPGLEKLPSIGKLYEVNKMRYLEIEFWNDYNLAKEEAKRLRAKISVKRQKDLIHN